VHLGVNMDTFRANTSDDPSTLLFPYKASKAFNLDTKRKTWVFRQCEQQDMSELWDLGIPAVHSEWSIEGVCKEDDDFTDHDGASSMIYIRLKWAMSANELSKCYNGWTYTDWNMRDECIDKPYMHPAKNDYKTEKQYIERSKHFFTQWHPQTPAAFLGEMPTKPKCKKVAKKPPVVAKAPHVAKAMIVTAPQVATLVATAPQVATLVATAPQVATLVVAKQAASKALEVIAPAAKRPCPSDNLQDTTPEGKLLTALKVPRCYVCLCLPDAS